MYNDRELPGIDLSKYSCIDSMVTVGYCFNFLRDFGTNELLQDRHLADMEGDYRTIVNLLIDQIEFKKPTCRSAALNLSPFSHS